MHSGVNGWNGAVQANINPWLGAVADFSGYYGTPITLSAEAQAALKAAGINLTPPKDSFYNFLFGPVVASRTGRFTAFTHALLGANRVAATVNSFQASGVTIPGASQSDTSFAMAFGGGVVARIAKQLSVRLFQADYLYTKHGVGAHQNNFRVSAGIVYRIGGAPESETTTPRPGAPRPTAQKGTTVATLGVVIVATDGDRGARVIDVTPNSAAAQAGLHRDDIINSVNGSVVKTPADLANVLSGIAVGSTVKLGCLISGAWQSEAEVVLANGDSRH